MTFPVPFAFWQQGSVFPSSGLVSYWKADTNGSFPDAHGSNDGTINGATYTASGKINGAYSFDGSNDYINIPDDNTLDFTDAMSIVAWVYVDSGDSGYRDFASKHWGDEAWIFRIEGGTGKLQFQPHDGSWHSSVSNSALPEDEWVHVAGVYSKADGKIYTYVNSVKQTQETAMTGYLSNSARPIQIGATNQGANEQFKGKIDEVGVWNRALTLAEITTLYSNGNGCRYV